MSLPKTLLANASALLFTATVTLGCVSSDADDVDATGSAATDQPITLDNHVNHPAIIAIRRQVQAVDDLRLTVVDNPGCDGSNTKFLDEEQRIRKYVASGGEGDGSSTMTAYYDAEGKLVFVFIAAESFAEEMKAKEQRVWASGDRILFQTIKEAPIAADTRTANFSGVKPREPQSEEAFQLTPGAGVLNPEEDFKHTGCPTEP
jgi:hypothetical protein